METMTSQKGAGQGPIEFTPAGIAEQESTLAAGAIPGNAAGAPNEAVDQTTLVQTEGVRYGYREDSPREEIALLHEAQAGNVEAFAELYR